MKHGFLDKLIGRLDRLDPASLQVQFLRLVRERGLLETIFQSIQEGIIVVSSEGRLSYANKSAEDMLGFSIEAANGKPLSRYIRGVDWERILNFDGPEWSKLLSSEIEIKYPHHRYINFYLVPLESSKDSQEEVNEQRLLLILRDITEQRKSESNLMESERFNAIHLLAATVAHEIGNPLNALNIHLQLLEREIERLPEENIQAINELLAVARKEVSRLDMIIAQFLRAIRPMKPRMISTLIETIIEETLTLLKPELENRNIKVVVERSEDLPRVKVDRNQMKQAYFNIIKNAMQAMPDGGTLKITLSNNSRYMLVSFHDSGTGIKREDMSRIFDPCYTTRKNGTGIGLMIVQRIIHDHGGQIEVTSSPQGGTTVTVILPLEEIRPKLLKSYNEPAAQKKRKSHGNTRTQIQNSGC